MLYLIFIWDPHVDSFFQKKLSNVQYFLTLFYYGCLKLGVLFKAPFLRHSGKSETPDWVGLIKSKSKILFRKLCQITWGTLLCSWYKLCHCCQNGHINSLHRQGKEDRKVWFQCNFLSALTLTKNQKDGSNERCQSVLLNLGPFEPVSFDPVDVHWAPDWFWSLPPMELL